LEFPRSEPSLDDDYALSASARATAYVPSLTTFQHRVIRRHLALIPVYIWLLYVWPVALAQLPKSPTIDRPGLVRDFLHFYTQGVITREHNFNALYDINTMAAVADRVLPGVRKVKFPPVYGPQVGLLFSPLTWLDYIGALRLWLVLTLVAYGACVYFVWRECAALRGRGWPVLVLALAAPGLHFTLSFGQASAIGLVCFTVLWLSLNGGRPFMAGLALGALAYKPHLAVVAAIAFAWNRQWRVIAGALTAVGVQFLAGLLYWGPAIYASYAAALLRVPAVLDSMEPNPDLTYSLRPFLADIGLPATVALVLSLFASACVVLAAMVSWRPQRSLALSFVVMMAATMVVSPHLYAYDLLILTPALLLGWAEGIDQGDPGLVAAVAFLYTAPIVSMLVPSAVPWAVVSLIGLAGRGVWLSGGLSRAYKSRQVREYRSQQT
jgi:hypothetical protein